jgi:hypothetical protein
LRLLLEGPGELGGPLDPDGRLGVEPLPVRLDPHRPGQRPRGRRRDDPARGLRRQRGTAVVRHVEALRPGCVGTLLGFRAFQLLFAALLLLAPQLQLFPPRLRFGLVRLRLGGAIRLLTGPDVALDGHPRRLLGLLRRHVLRALGICRRLRLQVLGALRDRFLELLLLDLDVLGGLRDRGGLGPASAGAAAPRRARSGPGSARARRSARTTTPSAPHCL